METLVGAQTALLQALREGPSYGAALARRVQEKTAGLMHLGRGNVYTALTALHRAGLVRTWTVLPGGRRGGRRRTYHELTVRGLGAAQAHARALAGLLSFPDPRPAPDDPGLMRDRLLACDEVSRAVRTLRDAMLKAEARSPRR